MDYPDDLITIGKLGRPRGLKGDIFVTPATDYPERFAEMEAVFVKDREGWVKMTVTGAQFVSGRPVFHFEGVDTPEGAARLTNRDLAVPRDELVELPEGTWFIFDLVDCEIFEAESGQRIGTLTDVEQYPANDVYIVTLTSGEKLQVPVVRQYVESVDVENKRIEINTTGLIEKRED